MSVTRAPRIGVMGGTFDPIHHGHLVAASEVAQSFDLDEVVFVPTGRPWQKDDVTESEHRYLMTVIATASNPQFTVSRVDIDRAGPTYTIDTLRDLQAQRPDAELFFITGADAVAQILSCAITSSCGISRTSSPSRAPTRPEHGGPPVRERESIGDPRAVDLVHRLPQPRAPRAPRVVPRARRCRAVHREAPPLSEQGMSTPDTPETPALTRRQLRELRQTGATPIITPQMQAERMPRLRPTNPRRPRSSRPCPRHPPARRRRSRLTLPRRMPSRSPSSVTDSPAPRTPPISPSSVTDSPARRRPDKPVERDGLPGASAATRSRAARSGPSPTAVSSWVCRA